MRRLLQHSTAKTPHPTQTRQYGVCIQHPISCLLFSNPARIRLYSAVLSSAADWMPSDSLFLPINLGQAIHHPSSLILNPFLLILLYFVQLGLCRSPCPRWPVLGQPFNIVVANLCAGCSLDYVDLLVLAGQCWDSHSTLLLLHFGPGRSLDNVGLLVLANQCWDRPLTRCAVIKLSKELPLGALCLEYTGALSSLPNMRLVARVSAPVSWRQGIVFHVWVKEGEQEWRLAGVSLRCSLCTPKKIHFFLFHSPLSIYGIPTCLHTCATETLRNSVMWLVVRIRCGMYVSNNHCQMVLTAYT